ncbi:hypothetical protein [Methylocucumis oryzae]|uniref:Uncharacterized protein n=1 Tax=Methylocucumis oryzae TaxID=1632867 RepID=A0A0F3IMM8_9GAMM|nr:hypothetical protein [Methylocucumis oryzae]KJV07995.1 hypothetical protein VZ94_00825 [Methylocucumis oryzae]
MEIELVTTKKKLTKSIFSQIKPLSLNYIHDATAIGFVFINKVNQGLVKTSEGYRTLTLRWDSNKWVEDELKIYQDGYFLSFSSDESLQLFKKYYHELRSRCLETQIFL